MKIYLIIGCLFALACYSRRELKYNFLSAMIVIVAWPIFVARSFFVKKP